VLSPRVRSMLDEPAHHSHHRVAEATSYLPRIRNTSNFRGIRTALGDLWG
jgi:hypothetical protein